MADHIALNDTWYGWFASNNTAGSGDDGTSAVFDVRLGGASSSAAPVLSGSATLLTHANYPAGCYEITIAATTGNGFAAGGCYAVFCTLLVDSQNPSGFAGAFKIAPVPASINLAGINADAYPLWGIIDSGTAQSASSTGVVLRAAAAFADSTLVGATIFVYGSTQGYWQERVITANALSGDTVTVDTWTVTPTGTLSYYIFGTAPASTTSIPSVNVAKINGQSTGGWGASAVDGLELLGDEYFNNGYIHSNVKRWSGDVVLVPAVAGVPKTDWTYALGTLLTQGAAGRLAGGVVNFFNVASPTGTVNSLPAALPNANGGLPILSSGGTTLGYTVTTVTTLNTLGANAITAATLDPTAGAEIADAVWDEAIAGHLAGGSTGLALSNAGSSGDPLSAAVPGAYAPGTAGHILGTALPDIAPGSANGLLRAGTNTATTFATLTVTGNTTIGGMFTVNSFAVSTTFTTGGNFIVTGGWQMGSLLVTGETTLTGAVTANDSDNDFQVNVVKVDGVNLTGTGTAGDEWRPA